MSADREDSQAELRATVGRVHALADAFADDGLARHGGNIAWHIEEAIANEKGDFPDAADRRIASQRERAEAAEADLRALHEAIKALADSPAAARSATGEPIAVILPSALRALVAESSATPGFRRGA